MESMHGTTSKRVIAGVLACSAAFSALACGSDDKYANKPRPPRLLVVTAAIAADRVSASPRAFGAGPVQLIVTNQTNVTRQLTLQPTGAAGAGTNTPQTGPINPQDTATLQTDIAQGTYELKVEGGDIQPARLQVGKERPSAQNDLLLP
jgi:hypothetical protein